MLLIWEYRPDTDILREQEKEFEDNANLVTHCSWEEIEFLDIWDKHVFGPDELNPRKLQSYSVVIILDREKIKAEHLGLLTGILLACER